MQVSRAVAFWFWWIAGLVAWFGAAFFVLTADTYGRALQHSDSPGLRCPGDQVVWVNTRTGVYHLQGERWFGRTKYGEYLCEKAANAEGDRETRNGQ